MNFLGCWVLEERGDSARLTQDWSPRDKGVLLPAPFGVLDMVSNLSSLSDSDGVLEALLRVLLCSSDLELAIGEIIEETARFNFPGVRLKEKARPTFCFVLYKEEKVREREDTMRSLASRAMSLAPSLTNKFSGSGRHMVLATWRQMVRNTVSFSS